MDLDVAFRALGDAVRSVGGAAPGWRVGVGPGRDPQTNEGLTIACQAVATLLHEAATPSAATWRLCLMLGDTLRLALAPLSKDGAKDGAFRLLTQSSLLIVCSPPQAVSGGVTYVHGCAFFSSTAPPQVTEALWALLQVATGWPRIAGQGTDWVHARPATGAEE